MAMDRRDAIVKESSKFGGNRPILARETAQFVSLATMRHAAIVIIVKPFPVIVNPMP